MTTLWQDVRYGLRMLARSPGFTMVAVLTLAMGIGANIAMFSVVNAVLLRPLPFKDSGQLAVVQQHFRQFNMTTGFSHPDFMDFRKQNPVFGDLAAYARARFDMMEDQGTRKIDGAHVSGNFFSMLGVSPELGRVFTTGDEAIDADCVAVIGHDLWRTRFGQSRDVLGQTLTLDERVHTIVGVLPAGFRYPDSIGDAQVWTALSPSSKDVQHWMDRNNCWLSVVGCLRPDLTYEQAASSLNGIYARNGGKLDSGVRVSSLRDRVVGDVRTTLWILAVIVGFTLLIVCANVANLCLARAGARDKEMAVRRALGANRLRLLGQLTTENVLLSLAGGIMGLVIAGGTISVFRIRIADVVPMAESIHVEPRVLFFGVTLSLLVGFFLGVAPAWFMQPSRLVTVLTGRHSTSGGHTRFSRALVVSQIAMALILSMGTGLMIRSMMKLGSVDVGFNQSNLVTFRIDTGAREDPQRQQFSQELLERLAALPHVTGVSSDSSMPCSDRANIGPVHVDGYVSPDGKPIMVVSHNVSPDYFRTLQMPIRKGRAISAEEHQRKANVVVISDSLAQRFWPNQDPLERELTFCGRNYRVIGVVPDVIQGNAKAERPNHAFFPFDATFHGSDLSFVVRAECDPGQIVEHARAILRGMDAALPLYDVGTFQTQMDRCVSRERFTTAFLMVFASIALLLIVIGIYGVVSCSVAQRTREIGIRMALGAEKTSILTMVLRQGLILLAAGGAIGVAGAVCLTRFLSSYLYGVSPTDPLTYVMVPAFITAVAIAACLLPARRAAKVEPMVALRCE
ncbi:MAG: ABC transporter permease [Phycisphaerales bacterium]